MSVNSQFTVNIKHWIRGKGKNTVIFTDKNYDILGFYLKSLLIEDSILSDQYELVDVYNQQPFFSPLLEIKNNGIFQTNLCNQIIRVNDDPNLLDAERQCELSLLFSKIKIDIYFYDEE